MDDDLHTCEHVCNNSHGSHSCLCFDGYELNSDGFSCTGQKHTMSLYASNSVIVISFEIILLDIDECAERTDGCAQTCTNIVGSYSCSCNTGYRLASNKHSCNDINECVLGTHTCNQTCINAVGSYTCSCYSGYRQASDERTCTGELTIYYYSSLAIGSS
jgi:hypothetical protein